jgi:two-component system CheB/CheR fusion protein
MSDQWISRFVRYSIAPLSVLLALAITVGIASLVNQSVTSLFFAAVMVSSWLGGLGPGLLATVLSLFLIEFFVVAPAYSLVFGFEDVVRSGVFLLVAVLISWLNTARRRLESESRRQATLLEQKDIAKNAFLALLAHELRNGLAPMTNVAHILSRTAPERDRVVTGVLERQTRHLAQIVDDLMDFSRLGQGKFRIKRRTIDLANVLRNVIDCQRPLAVERDHELSMTVPAASTFVVGDEVRLEQALVNLVSNAIKYTPHAGHIGVSLTQEGGDAVIRVSDNGIGIAQDMLPRIFDPFAQGEDIGTVEADGLGLGLALVRGIIERHDGTIEAMSAGVGRGSEFTIRLPLAPEGILLTERELASVR